MEPAESRAVSSARRRHCPEAMQEGMGMDCSPRAAIRSVTAQVSAKEGVSWVRVGKDQKGEELTVYVETGFGNFERAVSW
jgi:hypothetical protein